MLSLLAGPTPAVRAGLVALQVGSTVVSLGGGPVLARLRRPDQDAELAEGAEGLLALPAAQQQAEHAGGKAAETRALFGALAADKRLWHLLAVEWCAGFIFTLNSQAAGTIYWSSVVGVSDNMRSVYIGLEAALGGALIGFVTTLYVTRLYHAKADVSVIIPRIVFWGAALGGLTLMVLGTTEVGALTGIVALYLYYFVLAWTNIEFLRLQDVLRETHGSDNALIYMFLVKDVISGFLNNSRNSILMWLLAATGYYEPDCNALCASGGADAAAFAECVADCHAGSHAQVGQATIMLVRVLYVVVTPGAYMYACFVMRRYSPGLSQHEG